MKEWITRVSSEREKVSHRQSKNEELKPNHNSDIYSDPSPHLNIITREGAGLPFPFNKKSDNDQGDKAKTGDPHIPTVREPPLGNPGKHSGDVDIPGRLLKQPGQVRGVGKDSRVKLVLLDRNRGQFQQGVLLVNHGTRKKLERLALSIAVFGQRNNL